jgi:hypothetical protein
MTTANNGERLAQELIARGISPVPVPIGKKNPVVTAWQRLRITAADVAKYFGKETLNVGAIMGPASGGLTDIDLDCKEAMVLAPYFLPETHSIYGRPGKKTSHYLYTCVDPDEKAAIKLNDETGACIVELRLGGGGKGSQSIMPGSVHPSGEHYAWEDDGTRAKATCTELKAAIAKIAVGTILIRHWPAQGSRHDAVLTIGGFLARAGWNADSVEHFVTAICRAHGEAPDPAAAGHTARSSAESHAEGGQVYGMPQMIEIFGEPAMKRIAKTLGYKTQHDGPPPEAPDHVDGLPTAKFGPLSKMADRAAELLIEANVPFYQRGSELVRPVILQAETFGGKTTKAAQLVEVDLHYMRDTMCKKSRWVKFDMRSRSWVDIHPPADVALILLGRFGDWTFPHIAGIISTPTMRPNGTILAAEGYDPATRFLLVDPPAMPTIPEAPTRADAAEGLTLLKNLLREFPFDGSMDLSEPNVSRSVALSGILTTVCRGAFQVAPMHVGDAPDARVGKSYLLSVISAIATGQAMPVIGAGKTEDETEKRLGAAVIQGFSLICLDNVVGELGGDALCRLVEQLRPQVRVLGISKLVEVEPRSVTFFANGNNIVIVGDLCGRVIRYRLDPGMETPELRKFTGDPMRDVLKNRGAYIAAALTIVRAYIVAGKPNKMPQLASFNEWSDTVRSALVWLGEADPVRSMDTSRAEDPEKGALIAMLSEWKAIFGTREVALREVIDLATRVRSVDPFTKAVVYENPELRSAVMAAAPKLDVDSLGKWMRGKKDRRIANLRLVYKLSGHGKPATWRVEDVGQTSAEEIM